MIKLAVFDVDGTLVKEGNGKFSTKTIEMLERLHQQGIKVAIASGRPPFFVEGDLNKQFAFDYYVCINGAYVMDAQFKEISRKAMKQEDVESLIEEFVSFDDAMMFQFDDAPYCYHGNKRITNMIREWIGRLDIVVDHRKEKNRHLQSLPMGIVCKIDPSHIESYKKKYPHLAFDAFQEDHYDIHAKDLSKAQGIEVLTNILNMNRSEVIAFGDNYNDIEMLKMVGTGVAMGNAKEEVKAIADYVTSNVELDGTYEACKYFKLI